MVATYNDSGDTYEDTDFLYDGLDPTQAMSVLIGTAPSFSDMTPDIMWKTFEATDNGSSSRGQIRFRIEQPMSALTTVADQAIVKVVDHSLATETHRGIIRSRKPIGRPGYDAVEIVADDLGSLLDDTYIPYESRPAETMQARIIALWFVYRPNFLDNDTTGIASIGGTLAAHEFAGVSLRDAIEATISQADPTADYYVDSVGKLFVFTSTAASAPVNIDVDAPAGGEDAAEDLDIEYDGSTYANQVYIQGGSPEGSGFFRDEAAIAAVGGLVRTAVLQAPECTTALAAAAQADMFLARSTTTTRGTFEITGVDGWRAGQNVLVTDSAKGLSAQSFRIRRVTTRVVRPGSSPVFRYSVEFGAVSRPGAGGKKNFLQQLSYGNLGGISRVYINGDGVVATDEGGEG